MSVNTALFKRPLIYLVLSFCFAFVPFTKSVAKMSQLFISAMRSNDFVTSKNIIEKLPPGDFTRVHRSFIIRLDKIEAIEYPNIIIVHKKEFIPIGNSYRDEFMNKLKLI